MNSFEKKKIPFLVVDTNAFIKNAALQDLGENILTTPHVVQEITSKRQLRRLVVLPYDLIVKDTFPENVAFVTEFAKKTGDYPSLSATDIQVIALTYQLEKEKVGTDHLHDAPVQSKALIEPQSTAPEDLKDIAGFYIPNKENINEEDLKLAVEDKDEVNNKEVDEESGHDSAEEELDEDEIENENDSNIILKPLQEEEDEGNEDDGEEEEEDDDEDDDDSWITPSNIKKMKSKITNIEEESVNVTVACFTTDFAMQNVMKQIGLQVISPEGKIIKELRTFILRCYGCFKTTSIMSKVFCPNCGNKTLKKVAVSLNPDGTQTIHINFRRPLTGRGKRFSVPRFKGGKHANNPILSEDQPMPQQRLTRLARSKNNPLDDDYIAGYSPFVTRDVTSKSAMLGIRPHMEVRHWMKKNPNESKKRNGKKK